MPARSQPSSQRRVPAVYAGQAGERPRVGCMNSLRGWSVAPLQLGWRGKTLPAVVEAK